MFFPEKCKALYIQTYSGGGYIGESLYVSSTLNTHFICWNLAVVLRVLPIYASDHIVELILASAWLNVCFKNCGVRNENVKIHWFLV